MLLHTYVFYYVYSYPIVPTYSPLSSTKICVEPSIFKYASMFFFFSNSLPKRCFHQQPLGLLWVEPQNFLSHDWYWLGPSSLSFRWHYHNLPISTDSIRILYHEVSVHCMHTFWLSKDMHEESLNSPRFSGSKIDAFLHHLELWGPYKRHSNMGILGRKPSNGVITLAWNC